MPLRVFKTFLFFWICVSNLLFSADWFAVVVDDSNNFITIINLSTNTPVQDIATGSSPRKVAITPDATKALVTNFLSGTVLMYDLINNTSITIPTGLGPFGIAITPDGQFAFVADLNSQSLTKIDIANATSSTVFNFGVGNNPRGIGITPDGASAYITFPNSTGTLQNTVVQYDIASNTLVGAPIPIIQPMNIAITPDGTKAYVPSFTTNTVVPINLLTNTTGIPILVGNSPIGIGISPDGQLAIAVNQGSSNVTPINVSNDATGPNIPVGSTPFNVAITPDSKKAYVTDFAFDEVTVIDLTTMTVETTIPLASGAAPLGIAITPDQAPTARFIANIAPDGTVQFDASSSSSPVGTIVSYSWDFGDGSSATVSTPTISHQYQSRGTFVVTLRVTNSGGTSTQQTFTGQTVSNNGGPSAVQSEQITISIAPPINLRAIVKKNKFLNRTEYILEVTWTASPDQDIVRYRLYRKNKIVAELSARSILKFILSLHHRPKPEYTIASVHADGRESAHIPLILLIRDE